MRVGPTLDKLLADYPTNLRVVYKMHPLPSHPFSQRAAQAALAAQAQGKFLEMHHLLLKQFRNYNQIGAQKAAALGLAATQVSSPEVQDAIFQDYAAQIGLDLTQFAKDYASPETKKRITEETQEVMAIGASGTPANFVNGKYLRGAQPIEAFQAKINEALGQGNSATVASP